VKVRTRESLRVPPKTAPVMPAPVLEALAVKDPAVAFSKSKDAITAPALAFAENNKPVARHEANSARVAIEFKFIKTYLLLYY